MQALARARRAARAQALRTLGFDPDVPSVFVPTTRGLLAEADLLRLPPHPGTGGTIIVDDAGTRSFMIGMDPLDGSFPLT